MTWCCAWSPCWTSAVATSALALFEELVATHRGELRKLCRAILRDDALCDDALQQTFLRLWERLRRGRAPERPQGWLARVAVNASVDLVRRAGARPDAAALEDPPARPADAPEEGARLAELERRLRSALAELPEGQRTVFQLRHDAGLPLAEIATALGVALPTVKTQFARAAAKLQRRLSAFRPEDEA